MRILYLSFSKLDNSVNAVYIKGLRANDIGVDARAFRKSLRGYLGALKYYLEVRHSIDFIMIGYDSPQLVFLMRLISRKPLVFNALCSMYERLIISRNLASRISLKSMYYWLLDSLSFKIATITMLETFKQIEFCSRFFKVKKDKFIKALTGVDEERFYYDPTLEKNARFTVVFRGRLMPEAGAEFVVEASKQLEDEEIDFVMIGAGEETKKIKALIEKLKPKNLTWITDFLPDDDLRIMLQRSHLSLGQLSSHDRLTRTIPHKAFETIAMQLPYLTARNPGVLELFEEDKTAIMSNPSDSHDLAKKILWAKNNYSQTQAIAENAYNIYITELTPQLLAKKLLDNLAGIIR